MLVSALDASLRFGDMTGIDGDGLVLEERSRKTLGFGDLTPD